MVGKVFEKYIEFIKNGHFRLHIVLIALFLSVGVFIYYWQGNVTQTALVEQMLHREQAVSRSGALSIQQYLTDFGKTLSIVAKNDSIVSPTKAQTTQDLKAVVDEWADSNIMSISLLNTKGIITYNYNSGGSTTYLGTDLSDRDYFRWAGAAKSGDYYIGNPILAKVGLSVGNYIIPVASPVFSKDGQFKGAIITGIRIDGIVERYSFPLKFSDNTLVFLLDTNGNFVFSPIRYLVGSNFMDLFNGNLFPGKDLVMSEFKSEFSNPNLEGKFDVNMPNLAGDRTLTRFLITYSKVKLSQNNSWSLLIATPASDAFLFTGPFYRDQIVSLIYLIVVILTFSIVGITSSKFRSGIKND